jgi:ATP/maltotriose-dependent transcriptional regulator MalT
LVLGARGEIEAAGAAIDGALELGARSGYPVPRSYALLARAELLAARGEDAVAAYEAVRDEALPGNHLWTAPLVEALVRAGAADRARALLEAYAAGPGGRPLTPALVERCRGLLAPAEAVDGHFRRALELHGRVRAPLEAARTRLAWGERLLVEGRREDARDPLREAVAAFDRLGARLWADVARRQLRGAGALVARATDADCAEDLTPHELRVCRLAAQGMTNREVAAALFVSSKTVEHHLRNAFRKLGIRRRTELARVMAVSG